MQLRPYQSSLVAAVEGVWSADGTPLLVLPTGAGKSVILAHLTLRHKGPTALIAHRRELVGQISLALAREGIYHQIIAPRDVVRGIVRHNTELLGRPCYSPRAVVAVASVDSIHNTPEDWRASVTMCAMDEGHHILRANKWGKALAYFPNARICGVTATPRRTDGKGLGAHAHGVFTHIVEGPPMRALIEAGYLSEYTIYSPDSNLDMSKVEISRTTGDYVAPAMRAAVAKAKITGDVVAHYLRWGAGKLGVTFAVSVAEATILAEAYRQAGVPAEVVSADTPSKIREDTIRRFERRELLQLVNVDIFGEGFDLPAIEVVSFARPTKSFALYCQSFGRALRIMDGKTLAIIIDHVGNVMEHGLPDAPQVWSLDGSVGKKATPGAMALRVCTNCVRVYRRIHVHCPYCNHIPTRTQRSTPEQVDGDLVELDPQVLAVMRGQVDHVNMPHDLYARELMRKGCPAVGIGANVRRHRETQAAQEHLRTAMQWWIGVQHAHGLSDREAYRLFYLQFNIDVLSAQALPAADARTLRDRIRADLPFVAQCVS